MATHPIDFVTENDFIERLTAVVRSGFGIVPFVGSGCSSNSGILMGEQFSDYLAWTVYICVGDRRSTAPGTPPRPRWDLRRNGWPPEPNNVEVRTARAWALREFCELAAASGLDVELNKLTNRVCGLTFDGVSGSSPDWLSGLLHAPLVPPFLRDPDARRTALTEGRTLRQLHAILRGPGVVQGGLMRPMISPTSEDAIVERAIRSLYDWRATLRFLAQLQLAEGEGGHRPLFFVLDPDQAVIDAFNVHITRGRRPNLTHTLLCHLRQPARMRVLLTTNFDTLIEDAFAEQQRRLDSISVSLKGELPPPEIVHARDTVVKLHGSMSETRADFSLDDPPSEADRQRFFHYVRGGEPNSRNGRFVPAQLLVAGYSGSDARCVQLMKFVLDSDPDARLYWICNSKRDADRLQSLFPEQISYKGRIVATTSERVDLLLYEFYQRLCLSLPPGGSSYQINHNVPPETSFRPPLDESDPMVAAAAARIVSATSWLRPPDEAERASEAPRHSKLLVIDGNSGVLRTMRQAFKILARSHDLQKIWLELEDFPNTPSVAHELFQLIGIRRGIFQLSHAQLCSQKLTGALNRTSSDPDPFDKRIDDWIEHIGRLCRHLGIEPSQWLIALYGRNGPGGCSGWEENQFWDDPKVHPERSEYGSVNNEGDDARPSEFIAFLRALVKCNFTVLYAPYSELRRERDARRKEATIHVLEDWRPDDQQMQTIAQATTEEEFRFPTNDGVHSVDKLKTWLGGEKTPNACWERIDVSPLIEKVPNAVSFVETIRAVLHQGLFLDRKVERRRDPHRLSEPRWRFDIIFGSTLFRQSRHYTALMSEGVFRCPQRFNAAGYDNDIIRNDQVDYWLDLFNQSPRVFLRKPGGSAWLYRDIRLAIRCLALAVSKKLSDDSTSFAPHAAEGRRARTHFWIGDWYLRAFHVSGHADPLMEAAYHSYQAVRCAERATTRAESDEITRIHRLRYWRKGLTQLIKTLRLGGSSLRFWFGPGQAKEWFSDKATGTVVEKVKGVYDAIMAGSASSNPDAAADEALRELLETELKQLADRAERSPGHHKPRISSYRSLHGVRGGASGEPSSDAIASASDAIDVKDDRWWDKGIGGVVKELMDGTQGFVVDGTPVPETSLITAAAKTFFRSDPASASHQLQELVEWTYLLLRRAKHEEHAVTLADSSQVALGQLEPRHRLLFGPMNIRRQWVRVCVFAQSAIELSHVVPPGMDSFVSNELSKLMAIYGLALARLHRFQEAQRRFVDAHALLSEAGRGASRVQHGILEMRRAEAHLLEANVTRELADVFATSADTDTEAWRTNRPLAEVNFDALRRTFREPQSASSDWLRRFDDLEQGDERRKGDGMARRLAIWTWLERQIAMPPLEAPWSAREKLDDRLRRLVAARSDDAWGCLERADWLLGGRTHSVRWWGRLRGLQLRAFATAQGESSSSGSVEYRPLSQRLRHDVRHTLGNLRREGEVAGTDDPYNRLRVLDYYLRALDATSGHIAGNNELDKRDAEETIDAIERELGARSGTPTTLREHYLANVRFRAATLGKKK